MQEVIENKDNQGEEQEVVEETMEIVPEEVVEKSADELINDDDELPTENELDAEKAISIKEVDVTLSHKMDEKIKA